ncbi:MAG TPA: saccharopine dehydrogenase NADP-binding domain-containing protein, partial [Leptospiraceae bacterium]|nr:saccharopine dehydrogenase NADP-binding domain-containing protein [Leptospiraceae bacterium]
MNSSNWLLYGATGFTGELIVEEAVRQGMKPVIAGRSEARIREMAEKFGLEWKVFSLVDPQSIRAGIRGFACVLHAAGPFIYTAEPMMHACIDEGAHYLDITGEIPVFQIAT